GDQVRARRQLADRRGARPRGARDAACHRRRGHRMKSRRAFMSLAGGAAAWPLAARAQQADRVRRIGVLMNLAADDAEGQARLAAFIQGLQEAGWSVGRNVQVDIRWGAGDQALYRKYAAELLALAPDVVMAAAISIALELQSASRTVPIV